MLTIDEDRSDEAAAYTPGLKVKRQTTVRKLRKLPIDGEVLVHVGEKVDYNTVVARGKVRGDPVSINAADLLGVEDEDLPICLVKKIGDPVKKEEIVAKQVALFGLIKNFVRSPVDGVLESVSDMTGNLVIRGTPIPVEIEAYMPGTVVEVLPRQGAIIENCCAYINGIFGVGGERHGQIAILVDAPDDILTPNAITLENAGDIVIGGSLASIETIKKAVEIGVRGLVVGGVNQADLVGLLGNEIGVAITGHEEIASTLIVTEGFGRMTMSERTFRLLKEFEGHHASINGATQIRAGVLRPEIIIPHELFPLEDAKDDLGKGLIRGTPVRIIREPFFGKIGTVVDLPKDLQQIQSKSMVRVAVVEVENLRRVTVPRANLETIEE